jgi:dsDNA-specific endonuclease/ATPase MutS2
VIGSVGESYALEAGRRMFLPENVLERANALLDDESRRILALQKRLEEETDRGSYIYIYIYIYMHI